MGICWYCHWGWPKQVADIHDKYAERVGWMAMHYGPGHVVWSDENFGADSIQWCIDVAAKESAKEYQLTDEQMSLVTESLKELLAVPKEIRECEPDEYDDENPENFPPPPNVTMTRERVTIS